MKVFECPQEPAGLLPFNHRVFLGGGISGCPDWQQDAIKLFAAYNLEHLSLFNPRRADFDITNPQMSKDQIDWEAKWLRRSDAILFWFPMETLCPITLFELGKHAALNDRIFVGCHPEYARAFDVKYQLGKINPRIVVHDNLIALVSEVAQWAINGGNHPYANY